MYKHTPWDKQPQKLKLVDCGCHIGRWCRFFSDYGFTYVGVDQSEYALTKAREHNPDHKFIHSFLWDFDLVQSIGEKADIAVCVAVLQHNTVFGLERIIPKIRENLVHDGLHHGLFFFTESTHHDGIADGKMSREEWVELVEKHGFKLLETWEHDRYIFMTV